MNSTSPTNVHPHESEPPIGGTTMPDPPTPVASVPMSPPEVELSNPVFQPARPCHADAATIADGLHLKSERLPREDYAVPPLLQGEALFRHSGWKLQRQQTWDAMQRVNPMSMACYRFANCGSGAWIQRSADGGQCRCVCNCCHHRLCVPCQRAVGHVVRENLQKHLKGKHTRFVTLTLRHNRTPLSDQISRLFSCWSTLRRRKTVSPLFAGGFAVLEVKVSDRDGLWHVHLHIITEGAWVDQRELAAAWHAVTGDSSIVDVRQVQDDGKAAGYICKYVSKPLDASLYANPRMLDEYIQAVSGRKTMATFGSWRGLKLKERPADNTVWVSVGPLLEFAAKCRQKDAESLRLLALLRHEQDPRPPVREPGEDDDTG